MKLSMRPCQNEDDYFRARNFLREVFLLNDRLEHSWNVARLDYWRWHFIATCRVCESLEKGMILWETPDGRIAAVLNDLGGGEIRLHVHPHLRSAELENEMLAHAEEHYPETTKNGKRLIVPVFADDPLRPEFLTRRGFTKRSGWNHHYRRDLTAPLPVSPTPGGYHIRSMGDESEHASRSWCSWRAFHSDEPESNYDGDHSWYKNIQSAPLYRRDLDIVAAAPDGSIAAFCTIYYDDYTRSAVTVLVGVAAEHWRRGLGKAVVIEGMRRLKQLGCTRVFSTANEEPADALYNSVMTDMKVTDTWVKDWKE
jgi:mycothiol synthase